MIANSWQMASVGCKSTLEKHSSESGWGEDCERTNERTQNSHVFMRFLSRFYLYFETVLITYIIVSVIAIVVLFIFFSQFSTLFILRSVCNR